jgi:hypothetical protein
MDHDYYVPFSADPSHTAAQIDPSTAYYRPYHMLSGYRDTAQFWLNNYMPANRAKTRTTIFFDFNTARATPWNVFGHDGFSNDPTDTPTTNALYSRITASLSWTGLKTFDIDRGLWDIKHPHNLPLGSSAPSNLKFPFYRTTKMLLGYGVDLTLTLPFEVGDEDVHAQSAQVISVLGVPVTSSNVRGDELHVSAGDDAYPVLLGVLAQEA